MTCPASETLTASAANEALDKRSLLLLSLPPKWPLFPPGPADQPLAVQQREQGDWTPTGPGRDVTRTGIKPVAHLVFDRPREVGQREGGPVV